MFCASGLYGYAVSISQAFGKVNAKVVPSPTVLSTLIAPLFF
jgi:hypothetical protein